MNDKLPRVLIVEDSFALAETYKAFLSSDAAEVQTADTATAAFAVIDKMPPDVIVLDVNLPDMNGMDVMRELKARQVPAEVVVITGQASVNLAVEAMREGAYDFIMKPFAADRLKATVRNAAECRQLTNQIDEIVDDGPRDRFVSFIGRSPAMQSVYDVLRRAAPTNASVFITGKSGTGKELCAEALHKLSGRRDGPLITLNCAAIPKDLLESEIFGHTKGAFTGATSDRKGAALQADGGTLFLDEIAEMDVSLQVKLLRFLQEKKVQRVGEDTPRPTDVRIVCATNRDPHLEIAAGRFREDLYYRLHVVPVALPPLCEREADVLLIAQHYLSQFAKEDGKAFRGFTACAQQVLLEYSWPGNVRQLINAVRNILVMNDAEQLDASMVPPDILRGLEAERQQLSLRVVYPAPVAAFPSGEVMEQSRAAAYSSPAAELIASLPYNTAASRPPLAPGGRIIPLETVIRTTIENAIAVCDGSIPKAAAALEVSPSTLYRRIQSWQPGDLESGAGG